jgi:hypothetical protein
MGERATKVCRRDAWAYRALLLELATPVRMEQPTWRDLLLASSRSKMTRSRCWMFGRIFGLDGRESYRELRLERYAALTV